MRLSRLSIITLFIILLMLCNSDESRLAFGYYGTVQESNTIACPDVSHTVATSSEQGNVTLNVVGWSSSAAEDSLVEQNLQNFQKLHPNIHIHWTTITSNYETYMNAAIASGHAPDVFYLQPDMAPSYISSGKLLDLSPYMRSAHIQVSDYFPSFIDPFRCENGQVYGIPKDWDTLGVFYNKSLFKAAGIPFPSNNWTWNDMRTIARELTRKVGSQKIYGITITPNSSRWLAFLRADGGAVMNTDDTRALFNSNAGVASLAFYTSFQTVDHSSVLPSELVPSSSSWSGSDFDAFKQQRVAMVIEGGWLMQYLSASTANVSTPPVQYGIAPLPIAPTGLRGDLIFTNAWGAYRQTSHPQAAWELIQYMTSEAVQESALRDGFALPTLTALAHDPYFAQHPDDRVLFDALSYGYPDTYGSYDDYIHTRLNDAIDSVFSGQVDARTALDNAAQLINSTVDSTYPDPG